MIVSQHPGGDGAMGSPRINAESWGRSYYSIMISIFQLQNSPWDPSLSSLRSAALRLEAHRHSLPDIPIGEDRAGG